MLELQVPGTTGNCFQFMCTIRHAVLHAHGEYWAYFGVFTSFTLHSWAHTDKLFCCENIRYLITYLNFTKVSWGFVINSNSNNSNFIAILGNISVILYRQILYGWQMWDHSCAQIQISAGQKWREIKKCNISYYAQYSFILFSNVKIIYTHSRSLKGC